MPPSIADLDSTTSAVQDILGGICPLAPMQICLLWAARQEKIISPLAFSVYVAAHEVKFWRCKSEPGRTYRYTPYGFQRADINRLFLEPVLLAEEVLAEEDHHWNAAALRCLPLHPAQAGLALESRPVRHLSAGPCARTQEPVPATPNPPPHPAIETRENWKT